MLQRFNHISAAMRSGKPSGVKLRGCGEFFRKKARHPGIFRGHRAKERGLPSPRKLSKDLLLEKCPGPSRRSAR